MLAQLEGLLAAALGEGRVIVGVVGFFGVC